MIARFLKNYLPRHRNRKNQLLHLAGVPLTFVVAPVMLALESPSVWIVGCFLAGYALQLAGHAIEGNDAGEVVFIKKMLGISYIEYGPESEYSSCRDLNDDNTES